MSVINGEIRVVERRGMWHPVDDESAHICLHFWHGPMPVPPHLHDNFVRCAENHGNTVSIVKPRGWLETFVLAYLGSRGRREPSLFPIIGKPNRR